MTTPIVTKQDLVNAVFFRHDVKQTEHHVEHVDNLKTIALGTHVQECWDIVEHYGDHVKNLTSVNGI